MTDPTFIKLQLSDIPTDFEVVGGPFNSIVTMMTVADGRKGVSYETISKDDAYHFLINRGECVGPGCYIPHKFNPVDNLARAKYAKDLLIYLGWRLGMVSLHEPIVLEV